jgi:hypothetical protein
MRNAYKILVGKPEGKRPFGRYRRRCEDLMNTVQGIVSSGSGQGPVRGCCEHGNEPSGSIKGGEFLD